MDKENKYWFIQGVAGLALVSLVLAIGITATSGAGLDQLPIVFCMMFSIIAFLGTVLGTIGRLIRRAE